MQTQSETFITPQAAATASSLLGFDATSFAHLDLGISCHYSLPLKLGHVGREHLHVSPEMFDQVRALGGPECHWGWGVGQMMSSAWFHPKMTTESSKLGSIRPDNHVSQNPSTVNSAMKQSPMLGSLTKSFSPRLLGSQKSCGCSKLLLGDLLLGGFWLTNPASELCIQNIYPAAAERLTEQEATIQQGYGRSKRNRN